MRVLAFCPRSNSPGKKDATGAFIPEALAFVRLHGGRVAYFDNLLPPAQRFRSVLQELSQSAPVECVAFFCHGHKNGMQIGANLRNIPTLAAAIAGVDARIVPLYACDAARDLDADRSDDSLPGPGGVGGYADRLSRALGGDISVDAHTTAGHTTWNPHVRRFPGGKWIVEPGSPLWRKWRAKLREDRDFRLTFPFMSIKDIHARL